MNFSVEVIQSFAKSQTPTRKEKVGFPLVGRLFRQKKIRKVLRQLEEKVDP